jgi:glycosyltransferase involved in cell wall biosynthesis
MWVSGNRPEVWHLLTGEYPPQPGGVSDYTRLLARRLADAGDEVHVWGPTGPAAPADPGVLVHRLPGHFGRAALTELDAALTAAPPGFRLLVQYVPHMYGMKAMNLPFCWWLWRRRNLRPWVMFHEVAFPCAWGQRPRHNLLGLMNNLMAALVVRAADRVFVSIPLWERRLRLVARLPTAPTWLPVPSNVATHIDPAAAAAVRKKVGAERDAMIVGHFGTFGDGITRLLAQVLPGLLKADRRRLGLLIGRGGAAFGERLVKDYPDLKSQVCATGELPSEAVADHLGACDMLLQPYPDGVSSRRTSLMAGLALGLPIVTTSGPATEEVWEQGIVALAPTDDAGALNRATARLLSDRAARLRLGEAGKRGYDKHFSVENTIRNLREAPSLN